MTTLRAFLLLLALATAGYGQGVVPRGVALANTPQASGNTITLPNGTTITANNATSLLGKPIVDAVNDGKFLKYDASANSGGGGWVLVSGTSGNPFDQELDTTDNPTFNAVTLTTTGTFAGGAISIGDATGSASSIDGSGNIIAATAQVGDVAPDFGSVKLQVGNSSGSAYAGVTGANYAQILFKNADAPSDQKLWGAGTAKEGADGSAAAFQIQPYSDAGSPLLNALDLRRDGAAYFANGAAFVTASGVFNGSGSGLTNVLVATGTASAALNFGIVATGLSATQTVAVAGASVGDGVILGRPADGGQGLQKAWVSASGTVSIVSFAEIALTSTSQTYYFTTTKHP